jgi:Protein of unknown function (DUF2710)
LPIELTLVLLGRHTGVVSGSDGARGDRALVDAVLRDLREAAEKWELLVADAENTTYSVDLGDIQAMIDSDGKLIVLTFDPRVMTDYSHSELSDRLNGAFAALREEAEADNAARYGGGLR